MAEEFQESDVLFSDYDRDHEQGSGGGGGYFSTYQELVMSSTAAGNNGGGLRVARNSGKYCNKKKKKKSPPSSNSVPLDINIPDNLFRYVDLEEEYEDDGEEIIPPHVIVGRRLSAGQMAFSVCTGNGRTLKGRDLSQVRNSILRMTGFLET